MLLRQESKFWRWLLVVPSKFELTPENASEALLMLFSATLSAAREAELQTGKQFEVRPGTLLVWRNTSPPALSDINLAAYSTTAPAGCPPLLGAAWHTLPDSVFMAALRFAVQHSATFQIDDGSQLCRVLAAVAQTLLTDDTALRANNLDLVSRYGSRALQRMRDRASEISAVPPQTVARTLPSTPLPQPRSVVEPDAFGRQLYADRVDERGGYVNAAGIQVWYASFIGPKHAKMLENQDAAYACSSGQGRIIFATADGVTTSVGARFAAAECVTYFCDKVREELETGNLGLSVLITAAKATQDRIDGLFNYLVENWEKSDFSYVYRTWPRSSAAQFLANTRSRKRDWTPALSTTLIGGYLSPYDDSFTGYAIRIGDGVMEKISNTQQVKALFSMDSKETVVSSFLAPGRQATLQTGMEAQEISLSAGEMLLLSSDGLTRGHDIPAYQQIVTLLGERFTRDLKADGDGALSLLKRAADEADKIHRLGHNSPLFDDNISFVLISAGLGGLNE
jgi:serine/threonine protein phosphatase PrpC